MSANDAITWVMKPDAFLSSADDPAGPAYGLGIAGDGHFEVHRYQPGQDSTFTVHGTFTEALAALPFRVAAYLQGHGTVMVDWAMEVHAGRRA